MPNQHEKQAAHELFATIHRHQEELVCSVLRLNGETTEKQIEMASGLKLDTVASTLGRLSYDRQIRSVGSFWRLVL